MAARLGAREAPRPPASSPRLPAAVAEIGIDQSKLPGVKEVCRDFAVLEDHTLAHSLQEQEIEHHLATNVQRNRLVQYDLQVAKQLQEEEDRKAQARLRGQHRDLEQQDCEIAQEIQVKLAIEAEQQRQQEEADEDIARILQQKELREEKRRKKPPPGPLQQSPAREGHHPESGECLGGSPALPRPSRPQTGEGRSPQTREPQRGPPLLPEDLDLEVWGSSSEVRQAREKRQDGRKKRSWKAPSDTQEKEPAQRGRGGATWGPHPLILDAEAPPASRRDRDPQEKRPQSRERPQRTPPPMLDWEEEGAGGRFRNEHCKRGEKKLPGSERSPRSPVTNADFRDRPSVWQYGRSSPPNSDPPRLSPSEDQCLPRSPLRYAGRQGLEAGPRDTLQKDGEREPSGTHRGEHRGLEAGRHQRAGAKSRGTKGEPSARPRAAAAPSRELDDAEIARMLQEEELLASQVDTRAAQVAQDEEIARLLMAEEKKAYRKAKERETRGQDQAWKDTPEAACSRPREGCESHRGKSEKPPRVAVPPTEDLDHLSSFTGQHSLAHQIAKPEPAHKGYHHKQ